MSNLDVLEAAKASLIANLANVMSNPKPSYVIDGQSIDWSGYQSMLLASLAAINNQIVIESGPFQFVSKGV